MRAVRLHGVGDLRLDDLPEPPAPARGEVVVRVEAAGICGSDVHNFITGRWLPDRPTVPGHEFAGTVVAGGDGATVTAGTRVVADSRVPCGVCVTCREGRPHLCPSIGYVGEVCDGGFGPLVLLRADLVVPLGDQAVDPVAAAMAEPLAVALHAVNRLDPEPGAPVVVAGAGPIGALASLVLRRRGLGPVSIADLNADRLGAVAEICGATPVALDGSGDGQGDRPAYALDTTGATSVAAGLLHRVAAGGRIASVGIFHGHARLDLNRLVEGEVDWRGVASFADELPDAVAMLPDVQAELRTLAGDTIGLADVPREYEDLAARTTSRVKAIVVP